MRSTAIILLAACYAATACAHASKPVSQPASKPSPKATPRPQPRPAQAPQAKLLYQNNFEKVPPGKPPPEFLILGGKFAVVKDGTNSLLELPGEPVDTFGLLFGPTLKSSTQASVNVRARISGTALGRRSPAFGLGLYGVSGYKLRVSPAKAALELLKDEEVKVSIPYAWQSGSWTILRLQSRKIKGNWKIEGKAWPQGVAEPKSWMISLEDKTPPTAGRPSLWGMPYSDTPIRFDDLVLSQAQP